MELSVAIQAKVEVTPSNWNFGFQPTRENPTSFLSGTFLIMHSQQAPLLKRCLPHHIVTYS